MTQPTKRRTLPSHKRLAFMLVAFVVGSQMLIISGIFLGCFVVFPKMKDYHPGTVRCSGNQAMELILSVTAQAFALYAAEK